MPFFLGQSHFVRYISLHDVLYEQENHQCNDNEIDQGTGKVTGHELDRP